MLHELDKERITATHVGERRFFFTRSRLSSIGDVAFVILVAIAGFLFGTQGWNSRIPAFDMLTYFESARNLLLTGAPPPHGDISSYGSFSPPGTGWLMALGMSVFKDPRIYEFIGSAILYFGTLLGLYLLARTYFGKGCSYLAVLLYGLSGLGLSIAGSLWPIGHPFFYVWMVYLGSLWVTRMDTKYLAAATVIWTVGINVDLAILPAIFVLPALWLMFRPPLRWPLLLAALVLSLIVWFPYLRFEVGRDFADLRSQLLLENIFPANYRGAWCNPNLTFVTWRNSTAAPALDSTKPQALAPEFLHILGRLLLRGNTIVEGLLANFSENISAPAANVALLLMVFSSLLVLGSAGMPWPAFDRLLQTRLWRYWLTPFAIGLIAAGLLGNGLLITQLLHVNGSLPETTLLSIRRFQVVLVLVGIMLLMRGWIVTFLRQPGTHDISEGSAAKDAHQPRAIALSLLIPWLILILAAEPGRPERFFWLWPLHALFLAVFAVEVFPRFHASPVVNWIFGALLLLALVGTPVLSTLKRWRQAGWAGPRAAEMQVVDFVARQMRSESRDQAAIGYQIFFYPWMASYHILNPGYKVGAEFDLLFKFRYGIANTDQCAEGDSPGDEYLIVQSTPMSEAEAPRQYFNTPLDGRFQLLRQFGPYQVFQAAMTR